jgi:predicted nucleic acid-binding Zn ribbon protein
MIMRTCAKCGRPIPAGQRYCAEHKRELTQRHTAKTREYGASRVDVSAGTMTTYEVR